MRTLVIVLTLSAVAAPVSAQLPVTLHADQQALLKSSDPQLAANKKLVFDFWREVFQARNMDLAPKYMAENYMQHNPTVATGRQPFMDFFGRLAPAAEADDRQPRHDHGRARPGGAGLPAGAARPEKSRPALHDDLVRHASHRKREDRRALGLRDEEPVAVSVASLST